MRRRAAGRGSADLERAWRATAWAVPPVRPSADEELNAGLAGAARGDRGLDQARSQGMPSAVAAERTTAAGTEVRASALRAQGNGRWTRAPFSPADLLDELGQAQLIEIVDVDGRLHVLICGSGRIRHSRRGRPATP